MLHLKSQSGLNTTKYDKIKAIQKSITSIFIDYNQRLIDFKIRVRVINATHHLKQDAIRQKRLNKYCAGQRLTAL